MFSGQTKCFNTTLSPQIGFLTVISWLDCIWCIHLYFWYIIVFSTSRYSKLETFIFYYVYLTKYSYTHSYHFTFQVRCDPALLPFLLLRIMVDSSELAFIVCFSILDNPLDKVSQTLVFITYLIIYFWDYLMYYIDKDIWWCLRC